MSCCNPRGPSPASLAVSVAIATVMAALCGGPLISLVSRLWNSLTAAWLVVLSAIILAAVGASVLTRARRRRADREYENRKMLARSDRADNT